MLLSGMLRKLVQIGTLRVIDVNGTMHVFQGPHAGQEVAIRFHNRAIEWQFLMNAPMALFMAKEFDVNVTGLTLSKEQHDLACGRAEAAGLAHRVQFHLRDYREQKGVFDRIVSIGMFEHVGVTHYQTFFNTLSHRLKSDGLALLHTIGRMEKPGVTEPWVRKYIFPGGYLPALSEVATAVENTNMWLTDIEVLRLHYAWTLRDWRHRFMANLDRANALYDDRFCRMWEYYLTISETSFRYLRNLVFQFQITHRPDAAPVTRDYLAHNFPP